VTDDYKGLVAGGNFFATDLHGSARIRPISSSEWIESPMKSASWRGLHRSFAAKNAAQDDKVLDMLLSLLQLDARGQWLAIAQHLYLDDITNFAAA
jgi:hypothetical protein